MKKVLLILDGPIAKKILQRILEPDTNENTYDIVYLNEQILPQSRPEHFTFYHFDPSSQSKLNLVLDKNIHNFGLIVLDNQDETKDVVKNIRTKHLNLNLCIYDFWGIDFKNDSHITRYDALEALANGMLEKLPNTPVTAQNIGLRQGEIMELSIPFGSSYAYRYIGSIEQKNWKIFGLYRNGQLINTRLNLIIKPNDIILIIGQPQVLMQVYKAIKKTSGQFPMPFGENIYLYLDLYVINAKQAIESLENAKILHLRLKNKKLLIKITRPSNPILLNKLKNKIQTIENSSLQIDYANLGFEKNIKADTNLFNIGLIILEQNILKKYKNKLQRILNLKIPIMKISRHISASKSSFVLVNDEKSYEQISPMIFDISSQIKLKIKICDYKPFDKDYVSQKTLEHFINLAKIFNQSLETIKGDKNPIKELKKQGNILQILPLKKQMFKKRFLPRFFYTNQDILSFDLKGINQIFIPVVED